MKWNKSDSLRLLLALSVGMVLFGIDQFIKHLVLRGTWHSYFNGQLAIGPFYNEGIAFSISLPNVLLVLAIFASVVFVFWMTFFEVHVHPILSAVSLGLVLGGSAGNALDRIRFGAVTDYVHVFQVSVFNFADVSIALGLLILVVLLFSKKNKLLGEAKK